MNICHIVFCAESVSYMVTNALSCGGHDIHVCFVAPDHDEQSLNRIKRRLLRIPRVTILSHEDVWAKKNKYDRLIIQMFPRPHDMSSSPLIYPLAECSKRITLVSAGDRSLYWRTAYKIQWKEILAVKRWIMRIDRVVYKDGFHPRDLFFFIKSRRALGFNTHSMFMDEEDAFEYIQKQEWKPEETRKYCMNFMGSQDPDRRKRIVDSIRPLFVKSAPFSDIAPAHKENIWHEFSDEKPNALAPMEYVDVLSNCDFTLCPPGYSLITHRLVESLLRGSIPILNQNELDIYSIGLKDGVNCIAAVPENWSAGIERCFEMSEEEIVTMRNNIRTLVKEHLLYPVSSREMRFRLSVFE